MATKSMCEAVVEGMGGVWDRCDRQGNWVTATLEAVVAWNTPKPYHPAAVAFINRSLDHWAGKAGAWHDRFTHRDQHHIERHMGSSTVIDRALIKVASRRFETLLIRSKTYVLYCFLGDFVCSLSKNKKLRPETSV